MINTHIHPCEVLDLGGYLEQDLGHLTEALCVAEGAAKLGVQSTLSLSHSTLLILMCVIQNQCLLNQKSGLTGRPQAQGQPDDHHELKG